MSRKQEKKRSGHFCWSCERRRPNEKFSGRGHARHLCRDCVRLGAEELEYRSACRNLERCVTWTGLIRRKQRKTFQQYLEHNNPRVRALAEEILAEDQAARQLQAEEREALERGAAALEAEDFALEFENDSGRPQDVPW